MLPRRLSALIVLLPLAATACLGGGGTPDTNPDTGDSPTPSASPSARYAPAGCPFLEPEGEEVECGYLNVPEDRGDPDSGRVRIPVAVFKSHSAAPRPDPIVYLGGGPGQNVLDSIPYTFGRWFAPLLEERDLVLFDQRGAGQSRPSLDCPEIRDLLYQTIDEDPTDEQAAALDQQATTACHDRLADDGTNVAGYTSAENAADLADLREALGYEQWNLLGVSYGTRLALTTMRDRPQGIRSVILDSTYPPDVDLYAEGPANTKRAFRKLFDGCAADAFCASAYPDLEPVFYDAVDQLNAAPARVTVTNPVSLRTFQGAVLDGDDLVSAVFQGMYSEQFIPLLPQLIFGVGAGDYELLAAIYGSGLADSEFISYGMYLSVQCAEELPFTTPGQVDAAAATYPELQGYLQRGGRALFAVCPTWGSAAAQPVENQPVTSDIPTLVLAGEYDPITPPGWGRRAAQTLAHAFFYEFPGIGHGAASSGDCPSAIAAAFLNDPSAAPDSACISEMGSPWAR